MIKKKILKIKIKIYKNILSKAVKVNYPKILQPTIFNGKGTIQFEKNSQIGFEDSAYYYSNYSYIEARDINSKIIIGEHTIINNSANIVAYNSEIEIGKNCLIGINLTCLSSDFHGIQPQDRNNLEKISSQNINVGDNVFIGSSVTILKGVTIGNNSIIGAGSVVTKSFPENSIIAGNPAKLIRIIKND